MNEPYYRLPATLADDIDAYEQDVQRFMAGNLPGDVMKAKRVPCGVYEQRQDCTYMVRIRVAGGVLGSKQAETLATLASEYGNGLLHVTTRQDMQLHDIDLGDTPSIMKRLLDVGLTSRGGGGNTVRNVAACPYAGICPHERFDVTPFAHAVTEYLIALVGSYNLPRKYKIAFSGCTADCALGRVTDLGFIAEMKNGHAGFRVFVGGGMGANSRVADQLLEWTPASEATRVAEAIRRLFDRLGNRENRQRARLRYVLENIGIDDFRKRFEQTMNEVIAEGVPEWSGECRLNENPAAPTPNAPVLERINGTRCLRQQDGDGLAVPLHLPLGFLSANELVKIADIATRFSREKGVRTTRRQNLLIRSVPEENLGALVDELQGLETDILAPVPLERFVACAGAATCRLGLCLARDAARACADELTSRKLAPETVEALDVYLNGCPNACGQQPVGPIGLFGAAKRVDGKLMPAYRVTLGGRCNSDGARLGQPAGQVPAKAVPGMLADLAEDFQRARRDHEPFPAYYERVGDEHFKKIIDPHTVTPGHDEHPEFYCDFGTDEIFSLAGRGAGECGAGVFEVIRKDLDAAQNARRPFDVILPTARALLITRGSDVQDADSVFREFEKHFIDTGLVDEEFRPLLTRARGQAQGWEKALDGQENDVAKLLERVELLYSTLDGGLNFHPPGDEANAETTGTGDSRVTETSDQITNIDLSGVACPINFVKAKLKLEEMEVGEKLAIVLDDGEPAENVPASFRNEGQLVEEMHDLGDGHWRVVVRKKQ
jgi:sulfite reductase (ferredoxin)